MGQDDARRTHRHNWQGLHDGRRPRADGTREPTKVSCRQLPYLSSAFTPPARDLSRYPIPCLAVCCLLPFHRPCLSSEEPLGHPGQALVIAALLLVGEAALGQDLP